MKKYAEKTTHLRNWKDPLKHVMALAHYDYISFQCSTLVSLYSFYKEILHDNPELICLLPLIKILLEL